MEPQNTAGDFTGLRMTPQLHAVLRVLRELPGPATALVIHGRLRAEGARVGLTTTYRHLASLVRAGVMGITQDRTGRHLYHLKRDADHDHNLTCVQCGRGVRLDASTVVEWATRTAAAHGFSTVQVSAGLTGLCPRCQGGSGTRTPEPLGRPGDRPERPGDGTSPVPAEQRTVSAMS
ncbi:Fur family transcriptional regulator [Actinosynnema sp. NPDC050801]|jgi:Fur family ferric uptake transcriptional regulator|uniref:Fur family transcriptional regulator n=1 Tax=unclassified Actinosynnema TaxID=2637065 RepID=UPI0033CC9EA7